MSVQAVIQTRGLSKNYGSGGNAVRALTNLNLEVRKGEIFGYLGPNGAGKTTTIRVLLDLIRPSSGSANVLGMDAQADSVELHRHIGFLPGELNLWKGLNGKQVVRYVASVRGQEDTRYASELAERLELDMSKKVRSLSSGNKRKLGLIIALMHKPELLILDEPTGGLDPLMQQIFNDLMREVRSEGRTVFLSSHILAEVQAICDRVGILRDGDLKSVETVDRLTHVDIRRVTLEFAEAVPAGAEATLATVPGVTDVSANEHALSLNLSGDFDPVLRAVSSGYIKDIRIEQPSLEEIFLTFYGNGARATRTQKEVQS